jgi:autotransporter-associated beta strand protein
MPSKRCAIFAYLLLTTLAFAPVSPAATFNYTGGSGDLSDATKYTPNGAPGDGQNIIFTNPSGGNPVNNTTLSSVNSFTFNGGAGGFILSGNALTVNAGITSNSGSAQTINNNLTVGADQSFSVAFGSLSFGGSVDTNGKTLTVTGANNTTFSGIVTGTGNLIKDGSGIAFLDGSYNNNGYIGSTTINGGILRANVGSLVQTSNPIQVNGGGTLLLFGDGRHIGANTGVTLNGGTFDTGGVSEPNTVGQSIGALTLSANSTIDLGNGSSILNFAASNNQTWSGIVSILNWTGTLATGGGTDQLRFGNGVLSLTPGQLLEIQFVDPAGLAPGTYSAIYASSADGEIVPSLVPIPEPSTWLVGILTAGAIATSQRRRLSFILRHD